MNVTDFFPGPLHCCVSILSRCQVIAPLIPIFSNRRSEKRNKVTYRASWASLGKPIVPIVFFHMKKNDYPLNYIWRNALDITSRFY